MLLNSDQHYNLVDVIFKLKERNQDALLQSIIKPLAIEDKKAIAGIIETALYYETLDENDGPISEQEVIEYFNLY